MLPEMIKDGNLFVDGEGFAGRIKELNLPEIGMETQELKAGGMAAPIDIDMGLKKLDGASIMLHEFNPTILKTFGVVDGGAVLFRAKFAAERDDASTNLSQIDVVMRGRIRDIKSDAFKKGDEMGMTIDLSLKYYSYTQNGEELIKIDAENAVFVVGGVDRYAERRAALGIN